ncbi:response regulator [Mesobacterium sp. TK19101]|uniref:Response regulator n=1 Tax=Mesobacterium hydrothermale TaxID=3111907 RepID=A0ABU6HL30_9RHOB|nr:response regulator [Mesobacterium sp. TK19101]MEC3863160.1 response regulator [Mesobacterium sp. TK19101]
MSNQAPVVLHVDDDEDIREIVNLSLETIGGLKVAQCVSGSDALSKVAEIQPDLFLLDVMMPEMSGIETLSRLRKIPGFEKTPAIFMTAKARADQSAALWDAGAAGVITKPFDPTSLPEQIVDIFAKARAAS